MTTIIYRGDSPEVLINALIKVMEYARSSKDDFRFGPLNLSALNRDGLSLIGQDLAGIMKELEKVPGLATVEQLADSLE